MYSAMGEVERAIWSWLESLSHRQEDRLCCVCGSQLMAPDSARCWRCLDKGLPVESKPVWIMALFCCPTCGQPAELGASVCSCCDQLIDWVLPVRSLLLAVGLDVPPAGGLPDTGRAGRLELDRPSPFPVLYLTAGDDGKCKD